MSDWLNKIKQYGSGIGKGLLREMVPGIASGLLVELFQQWKISVAKVTEDVRSNRSLWGDMSPEQHKELSTLAATIGNLDFITTDFVINSIRKDLPAVASLFLGWSEAYEWLTRQIEELKAQAEIPP